MQLWRRAYRYVRRKKGKSLLLFFTVFLMSSFLITGLLLRSITELAITQTRQNFHGAFRVAPDMRNSENIKVGVSDGETRITYIGEPLNQEIADVIKSSQNIDTYNAVIKENVLLQGDISLIDLNGKYQGDPIARRLISMEADTCSIYSADFQRERIRLIEGEPIVASDKYAAVVGKELAEKNHWEIGDKIQLSPCEGCAGQEISVTIKGLFEVEENQRDKDIAAPVHLLENRIFIDMISAGLLLDAAGADYINFLVDDPAEVETIIEEIQQIKKINWKNFAITAENGEYEKIANPLINISILLKILLIVTGAMSAAVLSLIQNLFHKAREHESGILLSIGITKTEIMLQHFTEMLIIALASFVLSAALCFSVQNSIGKTIYDMAVSGAEMKLNLVLVAGTIITAFGCEMPVLFLSVLFSDLWFMRLSPRQIFSKLS